MSRNPKKVFNKGYNTKARANLIDYTYLDKLSQEELEWLAKFTDEYYGAAFSKNAGYIKKSDLLPIIQNVIDNAKDEKQFDKWTRHMDRISDSKDKYIQVSENEKKSDNIDLRKCRAVDIYYINENGNYVKNKKYKYSDENIIDPNDAEQLEDCNKRVYAQKQCMLNSYNAVHSEYTDISERTESMGIEDYYLLNEYLEEYEMIEDKDVFPKKKGE